MESWGPVVLDLSLLSENVDKVATEREFATEHHSDGIVFHQYKFSQHIFRVILCNCVVASGVICRPCLEVFELEGVDCGSCLVCPIEVRSWVVSW